MTEFDVHGFCSAGCEIVSVRGDLDGDTAPRLDAVLDELDRNTPVLVDVSRIDVLTSAGVQSLLRERRFGRPALVCPDGRVATILEIVQAQRVVPIYRDIDAALVAVGGRRAGQRA
jgi:anti-anti-sigma factor